MERFFVGEVLSGERFFRFNLGEVLSERFFRFAKLIDPARVEPMRLRISLWAGDMAWSGAFDPSAVPAAMFANWIQVSSYTPAAAPDGSDFTLLWRDDFDREDKGRWTWADWTFDFAVNDYTPDNSRAEKGTLIQVFTSAAESGLFPPPPADDAL